MTKYYKLKFMTQNCIVSVYVTFIDNHFKRVFQYSKPIFTERGEHFYLKLEHY